MPLEIINHPLAQDCLAKLRDIHTDHAEYKAVSKPLATLIAIKATENLPIMSITVTTPLSTSTEHIMAKPIVLVPILRAGLSMLPPIQDLFSHARTGFIGLQRSDNELEPDKYYLNIPKDKDATVLLLDPMIATGGSASAAIKHLKELEFTDIRLLSFLAAPEGIALLEKKHPEVVVYSASLDQKLDENRYIVPGLGDFGDRLFGTPHQRG